MSNNWIEFWNKKQSGFDTIMRNTTAYFQRNYFKNFPLKEDDVVLDYGCGPGFFLEKCTMQPNKFIGMDISKIYIDQCIEKFRNKENFTFFLTKDSTEFPFLKKIISEEKVTKIFCLSVLQYFPNERIVERFLDSIFSSGKMHVVFADVIPKNNSLMKDTYYVFLGAMQNNFLFSYMSFIFRTLISDYFKKDKSPLLQFDKEFFEDYAKKNNLQFSVKNLTIPKTRYTIVLSNQ